MPAVTLVDPKGIATWWFVAFVTLVASILLLGLPAGEGLHWHAAHSAGRDHRLRRRHPLWPGQLQLTSAFIVRLPHITFPVFNDPLTLTVLVSVGVMCIATIPESTAHLYQISLYVDHLAEEKGEQKYGLSQYIGLNLMLDGLDDMINGLFGSTAGTNYGENNSLMVITRNYSGPVLMTAGCIAILLALSARWPISSTPSPPPVIGGLSIYLFGVIGMQGIALMMSEKVNLFDPKQLAIGAVILIVGIGGNIGYPGGFLPFPAPGAIFPYGLPAIATAAILGILINLIFVIFKPAVERGAIGEGVAAD